jgi:tetratricopeptide (TPR) repeat protein
MYMPTYDRTVEREVSKQFIKVSLGLSIFMVAAFIHIVTWDKYAFEIIPLKAKQWIGSMSTQDYDRLAEICKDRKNLDCVESSLTSKFSSNPSQIETLATLGNVQVGRKEYKLAANTFATYFKSGGVGVDASYDYAKALSAVGLIDQAAQYYQRVIDSKPDAMLITVTQSYVRMLVSHNRFQDAKALIDSIRARGGNASMFMEHEMQEIAKNSQVSKS